MINKKKAVRDLVKKIEASKSFLVLFEEGGGLTTVAFDNEASIMLIADFLVMHHQIRRKVLAQMDIIQATLN